MPNSPLRPRFGRASLSTQPLAAARRAQGEGQGNTDTDRTMRAIRRLRFAPSATEINRFASLPAIDAISGLLSSGLSYIPGPDDSLMGRNWDDENYDSLLQWWFEQMISPQAGLHERMVWFWHGHLPSSQQKASRTQLFSQHVLLRKHALGNFRDLLQAITVDAAMLRYLDGDASEASMPNENFARELMELFALGVGHYQESDIRSAAKALSGWRVRDDAVSFDPESGFDAPLTFLGERKRWDASGIVDRVCDHPACAPFITAKIHRFVAGSTAPPEFIEELSRVFVDNNLEIKPVVDAIIWGPTFVDAPTSRVRQPIEWLAATAAVLGHSASTPAATGPRVESWWFDQLGQIPFVPPNVAGWPDDTRWVSAGQVLARANLLSNFTLPQSIIDTVEPTVDGVLRHTTLHTVSEATRSALNTAAVNQPSDERRLELLLALAVLSPEFSLA